MWKVARRGSGGGVDTGSCGGGEVGRWRREVDPRRRLLVVYGSWQQVTEAAWPNSGLSLAGFDKEAGG
uniref:Uncharacterized protein n=1 Tax=Oryza sativa subsp. japonica TaxID=39947 RepID=Q9FWL1_ORYSJ|nr:hypothetical protein [Oryza sativa Japonica Group]